MSNRLKDSNIANLSEGYNWLMKLSSRTDRKLEKLKKRELYLPMAAQILDEILYYFYLGDIESAEKKYVQCKVNRSVYAKKLKNKRLLELEGKELEIKWLANRLVIAIIAKIKKNGWLFFP